MAPVVFGSPKASVILKEDRPLRAQAAREARIKKAKRKRKLLSFKVWIEPRATERFVVVEAFSGEEAWDIAERDHVNHDEIVSYVLEVKEWPES